MSNQEPEDRDAALAVLARACDQLGLPEQPSIQVHASAPPLPSGKTPEPNPPGRPKETRLASRRSWRVGIRPAATIGLTLLGLATAIAWMSIRAYPTTARVSVSSEASTKGSQPSDVTASIKLAQPSTALPSTAGPNSESLHSAPELTHALADVRQQMDELKWSQSQMAQANAELAQRFKTALETAQSNANRADELKATQTQLAQENGRLTEQLNASQTQMTNALAQLKSNQEQLANVATQVKSTQDQMARLLEQKSHPRTALVAAQPVANRAQKPPSSPPSPLKLPLARTGSAQPPH